jgi:hypothetical protein
MIMTRNRFRPALAIAALSLAVSSAVVAAAPARPATALETISYETGPCFGVCPVYRVTVSPDGRGVFEGKRFTAVTGKRAFRVEAKVFAEFSRRMRGVRPMGEVLLTGGALCQSMATDMATIDVRWTGGRRPAHLAYNLGCDRERYGWKANVLQKAITVLPVAKFIGPREGHSGR